MNLELFKPGLSRLYGGVMRLRAGLYAVGALPRTRLERPVISVGNLTAGGTGKTPLAAFFARELLEMGLQPAILSRGYKGEFEKRNLLASDGRRLLARPRQCGDEPFLLARQIPRAIVAVGRDRAVSARLALQAAPEAGRVVFVLDDGFQHLRLRRDLDVLAIDGTDPLSDERPFPAGRLREPLCAARRADWIALTRCQAANREKARKAVRQMHPSAPIFLFAHRPACWLDAADGSKREVGEMRGKRAAALAGIARPERFLSDLRDLGIALAARHLHRDHHWFGQRDLEKALAEDADFVATTEKDAARMHDLALPPGKVLALRIECYCLSDGFRDRLRQAIGE